MNKKSIVFLSIFLATAVLIAGGVLWYSGEVKKDAQMAQKQIEEEQRKMEEGQKEEKNNPPKTFQDLIDRSETITLPAVDTTKWTGYYRNEQLGIEFRYPKEEGWVVRDDLLEGSACIGTEKYGNAFIEGEGECIVQITPSSLVDANANISMQKDSYDRVELPYFKEGVLDRGQMFTMFVGNNVFMLRIFFLNYSQNYEVKDVYYGILQTLKPLTE